MSTFQAVINQLVCLEIAHSKATDPPPPVDRLLAFAFAPNCEATPEAFVARYRELLKTGAWIPIAPAETNILEKLIWPLKSAIASYALGNYLSCVAMCGLVGEMVAMLTWDLSSVSLGGQPIDDARARGLFGSSFEKLGQDRRIQVLLTLRLIDDGARGHFENLRKIRRTYLHFFSQSHDAVASDARKAFQSASALVQSVLAIQVKDGKVVVRPELATYLATKGNWRFPVESAEEESQADVDAVDKSKKSEKDG